MVQLKGRVHIFEKKTEGKSRKIKLPKTADSTNAQHYPLLRRLWMWGRWGCRGWNWWHYSCRPWQEGGWRWSQHERKQKSVPGDAEHKMDVILSCSVLCFFRLFFRVEWIIHKQSKTFKRCERIAVKNQFPPFLAFYLPSSFHGRSHCCQGFLFSFPSIFNERENRRYS